MILIACLDIAEFEAMESIKDGGASSETRFPASWVLYERAPADQPWLFRGIALQTLFKAWEDARQKHALPIAPFSSLKLGDLEELKSYLSICEIGAGKEPEIKAVHIGDGPVDFLLKPGARQDGQLKEFIPEINYPDVVYRMIDVRDQKHASYVVKSLSYISDRYSRYEALYLPYGDESGETVTHIGVAFSFVFGFDNANWVFGGV